MTELEDRLSDLSTPTIPGSPAPSLQHVELDAAARLHRHRSARVLAAAAIIVLVVGLAVAVVRRPEPTTIDALGGSSSTTQPVTFGCRTGGSVETIPPPPGFFAEACVQADGQLVSISVTIAPDAPPSDVAAALAIIRQRLDAVGVTGATVTAVSGVIQVDFNPSLSLTDSPSIGLIFEGLPGYLGGILTFQDLPGNSGGTSADSTDTQP